VVYRPLKEEAFQDHHPVFDQYHILRRNLSNGPIVVALSARVTLCFSSIDMIDWRQRSGRGHHHRSPSIANLHRKPAQLKLAAYM
jgi:hypothetical protein